MSSLDALIKPTRRNNVRTGNIVEKIAATAKFNIDLAEELGKNQRLKLSGLKLLSKYFEAYVDNIARANTHKYHHVYEFNKTGDKTARLFVSSIKGSNNPVLSYSFKESKVPSDSGYVFKNKAYVMENGIPLNIRPRNSEYLTFEYRGDFYSKKSVFVPNPGGSEVKGSFAELFYKFMTNDADKALYDLGFFDKIKTGMNIETKVMLSKIASGKISSSKKDAKDAVNKISRRVDA